MKTYRVSVGNCEYQVEIEDDLITIHPCESNTPIPDRQVYSLTVKGLHIVVRTEKERERLKRSAPSSNTILAPMPGIIINILVSQGDSVIKGQTLMIMESMKMHMHIKAPIDGRIEAIHVQNQSKVESGHFLIHLKP